MKEDMSREQLVREVTHMQQRIRKLETLEREHKKTEEDLKESETRYRALFDGTLYCVYVHDFEGRILDANDAALHLLGYTKKEMSSLNLSSLVAEPQMPEILTILKEIRRLGSQKTPVEYKLKRKDGTFVWVEAEGSVIYTDGKPSAIQGIARDITERRQMEEILRESEQKYRTLTDNVNVGVYRNTVGPKGKFIEANPAIVKMFGYKTREEFLAIDVADLYQNAEDRQKFNEKMLKDQFVRDEELLLRKKDGTPFIGSVSAVAVKDEEGNVRHYDGIIEDITERKEAEEALRKSEEKYRTIITSIEDGYFEVDLSGNFTFFNNALCRIFGSSREKLMNTNSMEYMDEETSKIVYKTFNSVYQTGNPTRAFDWEIIRKDGTMISVEASISLIVGAQGEPVGFRGIVRDVTERKKNEEALQRSEEEFRLTFENAKDAIFWADPETGAIVKCNRAAEMLLEKEREEIVGHHQTELHPPDKAHYYADIFKTYIEEKGIFDQEAEIITKSGKILPVHLTASITVVGGTPIVQGIFRDITERKKAELELKESEERYRSLIEFAPEGIITLDTEGAIISCNTSALEKTGYTREEMVGTHFTMLKFLQKKDLHQYMRLFKLVLRGEPPETFEAVLLDRDQNTYDSEVRMKLLEQEGETQGILVMARDITERKRTEKQLKNLFEASRLINSTMDMGEIFQFVSDSVQELVGFDNFIIFLVSDDKTSVYPAYASEKISSTIQDLVLDYGEGLVGYCMEEREPVLLENAHKDKRVTSIPGITEPFVSQIVIPLVVEDEPVGALHISRARESVYYQADVDVLKPLSEIISSAIKNSMLYNEITRFGVELEKRIAERSRRIEILLDTRQSLQREGSWENGLTTIVESMARLGFERVGIILANPMRKTLEFQFGKGADSVGERKPISLKDTDYFCVKCVTEKRTIHIKEYNPKEGKQLTSPSESFVWVPIVVQDEAFAALGADNPESRRAITEEDVKDLEILAGMCAAFIDRTRILIEPVAEKQLKTEFKHWLDPSECYLIIEKKSEKALEIFCDLVTHGIPGFVVSRVYPEKLKRRYKLAKTPMLWLSQSEVENAVTPNDFSKLNFIIGDFTKKSGESVILLEGLEYLITQTSFETVVKYVEELKDIVVVNNSRLIVPIHEGTLSLKERSILEKGFTVL